MPDPHTRDQSLHFADIHDTRSHLQSNTFVQIHPVFKKNLLPSIPASGQVGLSTVLFTQTQTPLARPSISQSDSLLKAWCEPTHPKSPPWSQYPVGSRVNCCSLDKKTTVKAQHLTVTSILDRLLGQVWRLHDIPFLMANATQTHI